jgi:hypothetical protein
MGRHRVYADDAAKCRAYRARRAQRNAASLRGATESELLDQIRSDPDRAAALLVRELGLSVAHRFRLAIDAVFEAHEGG